MSFKRFIPLVLLALILPYLLHISFINFIKSQTARKTGIKIDLLEARTGGMWAAENLTVSSGIYKGKIGQVLFNPLFSLISERRLTFNVINPVLKVDYDVIPGKRKKSGNKTFLGKVLSKIRIKVKNGTLVLKKHRHTLKLTDVSFVFDKTRGTEVNAGILVYQGLWGTWIGKKLKFAKNKTAADELSVDFMRLYGPKNMNLDVSLKIKHILGSYFKVNAVFSRRDNIVQLDGTVNPELSVFKTDFSVSGSSEFFIVNMSKIFKLPEIPLKLDGNFNLKGMFAFKNGKFSYKTDLKTANLSVFNKTLASGILFFPQLLVKSDGFYDLKRKSFKLHVLPDWGLHNDFRLNLDLSSDKFMLSGDFPPVKCSRLLNMTPPELIPHLKGLKLAGTLGLKFMSGFELKNFKISENADPGDDRKYNINVSFSGSGCRVLKEPDNIDLKSLNGPVKVVLTDDRGHKIIRKLDDSDPHFTSVSKMTTYLVGTVLASEDRRFFNHKGFDWKMIKRALIFNLSKRKIIKGASSVSQQLVKNLYLNGERTLSRKLEEAILTWRLEQTVPKKRIIELYMNIIETGPDIRGIKDGAKVYFHKLPSNLSPLEAAHMASIIPAPRYYYKKFRRALVPDEWTKQLKKLLWKTYKFGSITKDVFLKEQKKDLVIMDY